MPNLILRATKIKHVDRTNPAAVCTWNNPVNLDRLSDKTINQYAYFGFEAFPEQLRHCPLYSIEIHIRYSGSIIGSTDYRGLMGAGVASKTFSPSSLTWNNRPGDYGDYYFLGTLPGSSAATNITLTLQDITSSDYERKAVKDFLKTLTIYGYCASYNSNHKKQVKVYDTLSNGTAPYVSIYYLENLVETQISPDIKYYGNVDPRQPMGFSWTFQKKYSNYYCADENWTQQSATFYWRVSGEEEWNAINAVGSTQSITIQGSKASPCFPIDSTIEWYLEGTDEDEQTSTTAVYSFTTNIIHSKIVADRTSYGYVNPRNDVTFSWKFQADSNSNDNQIYPSVSDDWTQESATFYWRVSGDNEWNAIDAVGSTQSITVEGDEENPVFPILSTIEWYLEGTDNEGTTTTTSVYSFSTSAANIYSTAISPVDTIEASNQAIIFRWRLNSSGLGVKKVTLGWRRAGLSAWNYLLQLEDAVETFTAPPNTFPPDEIEWYVSGMNIDGVMGGMSSIVSFISYGAPEEPTVEADSKPFATITWEAEDQNAFEITIDDSLTYGPYFGEDNSFTLPDYLENGEHTIKVRVMGPSGLWSNAGSATTIIENVEEEDIELDARGGLDVSLSWARMNGESFVAQNFWVYRDGVKIGRTDKNSFKDRRALGLHTYYVLNKYDSGYYSKSNEIRRRSSAEQIYIAPINGNWIELKYRKKDEYPEFTDGVNVTYANFVGDAYQSVYKSEFCSTDIKMQALFIMGQEKKNDEFKKLLGKPVLVKMPDFVGVCFIDSWTWKAVKTYYTMYDFTLHRIESEDFVDDTVSEDQI